ncbi:3-deoxy-D-manno-octulosonic acid transferase [Photobacterium jeanii]|uniref:3-deoxy-D-manno-octulosonic acid transferase n=1 Tax=Photobacterium jeanii TaxID=858640 RepID=A0A178KKA5_9GAMM|nr:lipid IV(A) 3-deoxy-D-manno-octulosonic acid transferase [Photobacterium jeanii]OAN17002.1 3-deoxy-D-manno-octulosonic acid transferase [Photobacterium jeanii]PST88292.1 3-deoxy-D-manno-octulosonic acid transferase [Photobacterium jeanii]
MAKFTYNLLLLIIQPLIAARLLFRSLKAPLYKKRLKERYGFAPPFAKGGIWLHSVSVGETIASVPLVKALQQAYPELPITITTMTPTGSEQVRKSFGDSVQHCYLPYDLPFAMGRLIDNLSPKLAIVMETELWPNMIHQLNKRQIPVMLANGRLSARSAKGYGKVKNLVAPMLNEMSLIAAQYQADGDRYVELGLPKDKLHVCGSVKFDIDVTKEQYEQAQQLKQSWAFERPVWIAASTHDGEDAVILAAHQQILQHSPDALLVLVPRHPERFDSVATLIAEHGFSYLRKSEQTSLSTSVSTNVSADDYQVVLGDTMGELMTLFGVADVAFIGGSLIERGGHNPLEPAAYGLPLIMGPHTFNFSSICQMLTDADALKTVTNSQTLATTINRYLQSPQQAKAQGGNALQVLKLNQGSLAKHLELIAQLLEKPHVNH